MTVGIVLGVVAGIGLWCNDHRPERPPASFDVSPSRTDLELEPSSSSVQHELAPPPSRPFYASLFVAGATWDLPCLTSAGLAGDVPAGTQRCHVDSVDATATETSARIACWFVREPDVRPPDPAINTYVMTARGLYINGTSGEPIFTPNPIPKPMPKRWGQDPPSGLEPDRADAMIRHHGAWCRIYEIQGMDTSFGMTDCISRRGIVGSSNHRDFFGERCGDVP